MKTKEENIAKDVAVKRPESGELSPWNSESFDANDVLDAYFEGKKAGVEDLKTLMFDKLNRNFEITGTLTDQCINFIRGKGFEPVFAKLKVCSYKSFSVLIGVRKADYLDENFMEVYDFAGAVEAENESDLFSVSFHFAYKDDHFNEKAVGNDGYKINFKKI